MEKAELEASLNSLDIWLIVFGILVAIGVVGESVAGFLHWRRSGALQRVQTAENLEQQRSIASLTKDIALAQEQTAKAQLQLARLINPRSLNPTQYMEMIHKLSEFKGSRFDVAIVPDDREILDLLELIERVLRQAGWVEEPWESTNQLHTLIMDRSHDGLPAAGIVAVTGVIFGVEDGHKETLMPVAKAAADALNDADIIATTAFFDKTESANRDVIHVLVGKKPMLGPSIP